MIVRFFVPIEDMWHKYNKIIILLTKICVSWKDHRTVSDLIFYSIMFVTVYGQATFKNARVGPRSGMSGLE